MENQTFCEYCRKDVNFDVIKELITDNLHGEDYTYEGKKAICKECKNEIFVDKISDYNLEKLY